MDYVHNPDKLLLKTLLLGEKVECHTVGNPLAEALQLEVKNITQNTICLKFNVGHIFTQGHGVVQGGIIGAMLDFGAAYIGLLNTEDDKSVVTTNFSINYLRAAPTGIYYVNAELDKVGKKMVFASAKLFQQPDKIIANAVASMAVV